jgi:hypothetical protein
MVSSMFGVACLSKFFSMVLVYSTYGEDTTEVTVPVKDKKNTSVCQGQASEIKGKSQEETGTSETDAICDQETE